MLLAATVITLFLYAFVVSQPFFYVMSLGDASDALTAPAYVELRHAINRAMNARLPRLYVATAVSGIALAVIAARLEAYVLATSAAVSVVGLVVDLLIALRTNIPINRIIETWTSTAYPDDWATYRRSWTAAFTVRQGVLTFAYATLLVGVAAS